MLWLLLLEILRRLAEPFTSLPRRVRPLLCGLVLLLGLTTLTPEPALAFSCHSGQRAASGSAAVVELGASENARLSAERAGENVVLAYEIASGSPVAARASKVEKSVKIEQIGRFTKTTEVRPGRGPGQSRAEYVRYKNERGEVVRTYKDSYDRAGNFQGRKPLQGGPEGRPVEP